MRGSRRGQTSTSVPFTAIIVVIAASITLILMDTFQKSVPTSGTFELAGANTTTLCNGILGCGHVGPMKILTPLLLIVCSLFIMSIVAPMMDSPATNDDRTDDVVAAYVDPDGDIDTELELEARLEETIDEDDVWEDL
jgi:hypothetical protein